jgi:hypothetical protein
MEAVQNLINDWQRIRAEIADVERAEHPDIVDSLGRAWVWRGRGDLYSHCGNAAPSFMIGQFGRRPQAILDNPNYDLCDVCIDGRVRNAPVCKAEWNCSHKWCADHQMTIMQCGGCSSEISVTRKQFETQDIAPCGACGEGADLAHARAHA